MNNTQKFVLFLIFGLIILGVVAYYLLQEAHSIARDQAKQEAMAQGMQGAKEIWNRFAK